jgi:ATP-dependent RNA helicase DDX51/DBP6
LPNFLQTKSKTRYLKAKKDRRKKRIKAASTSANAPTRLRSAGAGLSSDGDEDHPVEESELPEEEKEAAQPEQPQEATGKHKHKHKRRTALPSEDEADEPMLERTTSPIPTPPPRAYSPSSLPTLPSFPLPTHPAPPSKATLALQGLDRAILEAEVINPAASAPLPRLGDPDPLGLGLDDQMRDRLVELGVDSLFAGE